MEILTVGEVAALLRISRTHVYELSKERTPSGDLRENPLPVVRFGTLRIGLKSWSHAEGEVRTGVDGWLIINMRGDNHG
jgi:excisionase family DNA binding protein